MDAFPRRSRFEPEGQAGTPPVCLIPSQLQSLFGSRLNDICAGFEEWGIPLTVIGRLGTAAPTTYPRYYQLPLHDPSGGSSIGLEVSKALLADAGVQPGDHVKVMGALRARVYRGEVSPRFEVLALSGQAYEAQEQHRAEQSVLDLLRDLPWSFHPYPQQRDARIALIHPASSSARVPEDFLQALGGAWRPERVRCIPAAMNDPRQLAEAVASVREEVVVIIRGGGQSTDFLVFEQPDVLMALSECRAHRVLGVGHSADRTLAERVMDHTATTPADAGHYVRRMSGRIWQEQEEARARDEEMAAMQESIARSLARAPAVPLLLKIRNTALLVALGALIALILERVI